MGDHYDNHPFLDLTHYFPMVFVVALDHFSFGHAHLVSLLAVETNHLVPHLFLGESDLVVLVVEPISDEVGHLVVVTHSRQVFFDRLGLLFHELNGVGQEYNLLVLAELGQVVVHGHDAD